MYLVQEKSSSTSSIDDDNTTPQNSSSSETTATPNRKSRWSKKRKRNSKPNSSLLLLNNSDESACETTDHESSSRKASPIPWSSDLHKEFVRAIFEIGIEESSPAVIAEQMITKNNYNIALQPDDDDDDDEDDSAKSLLPKHNPVAMAAALASMDESKQTPIAEDLPEEAEYYKRELTGERLKSHLQKMRKQRGREKEAFLGDYHRFLTKRQILEKEQKQVEKLKEQRKEEARRRKLKRKRPSTLLDASSLDHAAKFNNNDEDVTKEEEERLLSMYLPLRSAVAEREDFDSDVDVDEASTLSPFPAGGKAIGMVTWAVREQEAANRKKRKQRQRQLELQQQQQQQQHQKHRISSHHHSHRAQTPCPNGWETASVDSWTSHTAIAAGKLATALGPKMSKETHETGPRIIDCASSEDNHTDEESDSEDEFDQFKAIVPTLTKAEQNSPLGVSLRLTWDMIRHMHGVIVEDRASKIKEKQLQQKIRALRQQQKQQQQQQQQQNSPQKTQMSLEESSSENEELPQSSKILPQTKKHHSPESKVGGNQTEQILPPMTTTHMPNQNYHGFHGTAASVLLHHHVWNPSSNTHLLAAMAANGTPPAHLVQALRGAVFDDKPSLLGAFLGNAPSVVSPQSQTPPEGFAEPEKPWNPSNSAFGKNVLLKPLAPPKDPLIGLQNPLSFLPESRSHSPLVSLSTPTTPAEAMFRSLLQHNQQSKEQHYPV